MAHRTTKFLNKPAICIYANAVLRAACFAQLPKLLLDVLESPLSNCAYGKRGEARPAPSRLRGRPQRETERAKKRIQPCWNGL
jgi:hypothetical protein